MLLGRLDDGLGYYRFTYIGGHTQYVGVMAQDVQNVMPDAVTRDKDGYLRVSYDKLGLPFETYNQWLATERRDCRRPRRVCIDVNRTTRRLVEARRRLWRPSSACCVTPQL